MKKSVLKAIKDEAKDKVTMVKRAPTEINDRIAATNRAKFLDRWMGRMEELGRPCTSYEEIDYNDPQIHVEWLLCDPSNIVAFQSKKLCQAFLDTLTPEERDYLFSDPAAVEQFRKHKLKTALMGIK